MQKVKQSMVEGLPEIASQLADNTNKIEILSKDKDMEGTVSKAGDTMTGVLEVPSLKTGTHSFEHYQIPGEDTELAIVKRDGSHYTILEVLAPTGEIDGHREATITLMREVDPDTGAPEFLDFYNMNYNDSKQMGIRIQTRGVTGILRDFVFEFDRGRNVQEVMRIKPSKNIIYYGNAHYQSADDQFIEFQDENGNRAGYFGRFVSGQGKKVLLSNSVSGSSFELNDEGYTTFQSPVGDFYVYLKQGAMFINDSRVQTQHHTTLISPDGSTWKAEIDDSGTVSWVKRA